MEAVTTRSSEDIKAQAKSRALMPKRDDLRKMFPGREREEFNPESGKREWVIDVPLRESPGQPLTKEGREYVGAFAPHMKAETERGRGLAARRPTPVRLRDGDGGVRLVPPHLADATARRNRWHSGSRVAGLSRTVEGPQGMLWRRSHGRWEPTGVTCLTRPLFGGSNKARGLQQDPDGRPWRCIEGRWREAAR